MKKSIFTLAFLALVAFASAQTLQFELDGRVFANNEVFICPSEPNMTGELAQEMQLRNLTNQTLSVVVMKEEIQMVPGTENSFCWGSCYDPTVTISRPNELEGNSVSLAGPMPSALKCGSPMVLRALMRTRWFWAMPILIPLRRWYGSTMNCPALSTPPFRSTTCWAKR